MGLLNQAIIILSALTVVLACAVVIVTYTRAERFSHLLFLKDKLADWERKKSSPEETRSLPLAERRMSRMETDLAFGLQRLPPWLIPLLDYAVIRGYSGYGIKMIFRVTVLNPLAMARGQILMAFIGSLTTLVGLLFWNTSLILVEALGILTTVLGLQVFAGAIREGALSPQEPEDVAAGQAFETVQGEAHFSGSSSLEQEQSSSGARPPVILAPAIPARELDLD
jgi:hypothetical protein